MHVGSGMMRRMEGVLWKSYGATLHFMSASRCAVSRTIISLVQPGRIQREVLGSSNLPGPEREKGQEHIGKASIQQKHEEGCDARPAHYGKS